VKRNANFAYILTANPLIYSQINLVTFMLDLAQQDLETSTMEIEKQTVQFSNVTS